MKILSIDTSTEIASIAVLENDLILGQKSNNDQRSHSEKIMPLIRDLLNELNLKSSDIDGYSVAIGPGSYTGLRIGVATAKALAQVHNKPIVPISSLEGIANNIPLTTNCALIDARNESVFVGCYGENKIEDTYMSLDELLEILKSFNTKINLLGNGAILYKDKIVEVLGDNANIIDNILIYKNASSIAKLASVKFDKDEVSNYFEIKPIYLRENTYAKINK